MIYNNSLILISGPAASGKTTIIKQFKNNYSVHYARPSDSYIELAKQKNIPVEQAFTKIDRNEAEEHFCNICKKYPLVVGDQHLAIQFKRDSQMATSNTINLDVEEEYSEAVSKQFIEKLKQSNINIFIILLKADPKILFERAKSRYDMIGHTIRNKSEEEVKKEVEAETNFFNKLVKETGINSCVIDTTNKTEQEVYLDALQKTNEFGEKAKSTTEWTREL